MECLKVQHRLAWDEPYAVAVAALLSTALSFVSTHALQLCFLQSIGTTSSVLRGLGQPGPIIRPDSNIRGFS
jgi:hypothetical protein